ncbi:2941_t:CDS:2, partial [Entrophospora sp. SA101]
ESRSERSGLFEHFEKYARDIILELGSINNLSEKETAMIEFFETEVKSLEFLLKNISHKFLEYVNENLTTKNTPSSTTPILQIDTSTSSSPTEPSLFHESFSTNNNISTSYKSELITMLDQDIENTTTEM